MARQSFVFTAFVTLSNTLFIMFGKIYIFVLYPETLFLKSSSSRYLTDVFLALEHDDFQQLARVILRVFAAVVVLENLES